jgi:hypothetical protein
MNKENKRIYERAIFQTKLWKYVAWSLPLIWLASEFLLYMLGMQQIANKFLLAGGMFFFIISVVWWWWAVDTIRLFAEAMQRTTDNFVDIKKELRKVRQDLNK